MRNERTSDLLRIGCGLLIVSVMLFPLYWMANASLQAQWALLDPSPKWFPLPPLIDGYRSAAGSQWPHIVTSCAVASAAALLSLAVAAPCAYALVVFRMRWTTLFILLMLIAQMLPHIVMANALYAIYARLGLLDTYYGLILADNGSPWFISGAPDDRWSNDALHALGGLHGSDFEAVDVSSLMASPNSAAVRH